jgi:hypothetical protein
MNKKTVFVILGITAISVGVCYLYAQKQNNQATGDTGPAAEGTAQDAAEVGDGIDVPLESETADYGGGDDGDYATGEDNYDE